MKHCDRSQIDQDEVLDNCCYITSALVVSTPNITLLRVQKRYYLTRYKNATNAIYKNL